MIRVGILGCGMMGQEHVSYILKYQDHLSISFLCDPNQSSIDEAMAIIENSPTEVVTPRILMDEKGLLQHVNEIDLLVIASPNYWHTPQLLRWSQYDITILVEKPVAISDKQVSALEAALPNCKARIWVAMEYRFIPAINKLTQLLPEVGDIKKVTIRENRYPFLSKVGEWNKDTDKSGDTLVEKCCHFFDLFRLITSKEMSSCVSKVHRGLLWDHYGYNNEDSDRVPIIDSAYVLLDFDVPLSPELPKPRKHTTEQTTLGCLELCMFAEGSRHQEEIIVTGMKGRIEAYLPENKVFLYQRPTVTGLWKDKSKPPPDQSFTEVVYDCSDLRKVYDFADEIPEMHSGYHYCSTAIEWKFLIDAIKDSDAGKPFVPKVSLLDGIRAVQMGISSMNNITGGETRDVIAPVIACSSKSSENLLDLVLSSGLAASPGDIKEAFMRVIDACDGEYKVNFD